MVSSVEIWQRFRDVSAVRFQSESRTGRGWSGTGGGVVNVSEPAPGILLFAESGEWWQDGGKPLRFTNVFRWTIIGERLRLEHLRFGANHPVFLFDMAADGAGEWREVSPHVCRADCYQATLRLEVEAIFLRWTIRGPNRDDSIEYVYR